ncbi:YceD family protein [Methyloferula stellata]|uniref:YceD family protein n=1 Tax=Methyloferula stellata TaxID=876270 RepID=UPI0003807E57|nr:DUF177 domain-containing protein [Methyloferula stellata]
MKPKSSGKPSGAKSGGSDLNAGVPFSRLVTVDPMPDEGFEVAIEADAAERAALAALDGLVDIGKLDAVFHVMRRPQGRVNVRGEVRATITQTCVVSLDPFESAVAEQVDVDFMRPEEIEKAEKERAKREKAMPRDQAKFEEEDEDPPDPIVNGKIDLGVLATEFLALALDPYPKKPGVSFEEVLTEKPEERESPFAILRKWDKTS